MASNREKRNTRKSAARRRAEQHQSGYSTTCFSMPEGIGFFEAREGTVELDVIPYIAGKGNPYADEGDLYFERTFWKYRGIGPAEKDYIAPSKTFGEPDFIQEYRQQKSRDPNADPDYLKSLEPKERQIFLVYDHKAKDKGIQLFESSYHTFGKLLDTRIKNSPEERGWDLFYLPDETGFTLEISFEKESAGAYSFLSAASIDFIPRREPLPKEIAEHGFCLDDFLVKTPYEELKKIFLGVVDDDNDGGDSDRPRDQKEDPSDKNTPLNKETSGDKKETPPKKETLVLNRGDYVEYMGEKHEVLRVSENGGVTLLGPDDDPIKGVSLDEVRLWAGEEKEEEVPFEESKPPKKEEKKKEKEKEENGTTTEEGDWDEDWD